MTGERAILEGLVSVLAALRARSRPIEAIAIRRDKWRDREMLALQRAARAAGVPVEAVGADVLDAHASGRSHGGVLAFAGPRTYVGLAELAEGRDRPFIAMLDGIEDPFNFGYAVRALYAAGADGLVMRPRDWLSAAGVVARASAGASELLPIAVAATALDAAAILRERGLTIACTAREGAVSLYAARLTVPLFLVIGGERRGITRSFLDRADLLLEIPYGREFAQSLGSAAAATVLAFEIMRQRRGAGGPSFDSGAR